MSYRHSSEFQSLIRQLAAGNRKGSKSPKYASSRSSMPKSKSCSAIREES